jgi:hypothetical protein
MSFGNETVTLPVGLEIDGTVYKTVTISEMNGYDEENMSARSIQNNGAKAQTILLRRSIQEIEGLVSRKRDPNELIKTEYVHKMCSYDRDFLFFCIRALGESSEIEMGLPCDACGNQDMHVLNIDDLEVYDWEGDKQEIPFVMSKGIFFEDKMHTEGTWAFLTGKQQELMAKLPQERIVSSTLGMCVSKLGDMSIRPTEEMFRRLTSRERVEIFTQVAEEAPGVNTILEHECTACGKASQHNIDVSRFFNSPTQKETPKMRGKTTRRKLRKA